jgi:hypothetical protein
LTNPSNSVNFYNDKTNGGNTMIIKMITSKYRNKRLVNLVMVFWLLTFMFAGCKTGGSGNGSNGQDNNPPGIQLSAEGQENTLEIASWNLKNFPASGSLSIDRIFTIISQLDIDLYAIQEIADISAFQQLVDRLSEYQGGSTKTLRLDDHVSDYFSSVSDHRPVMAVFPVFASGGQGALFIKTPLRGGAFAVPGQRTTLQTTYRLHGHSLIPHCKCPWTPAKIFYTWSACITWLRSSYPIEITPPCLGVTL